MGYRARLLCLGLGFFLVTLLLFYAAFHQLYLRGMQAEAKLMTSYLHTLERVYKIENKRFVYWSEPYGAMQLGVDNCRQPAAAAEVGFTVPGCHREQAPLPRYSFRVLRDATGDRLQVEARSGSDALGRSFVCFDAKGHDLWQSSQNLEFAPIESCW